MQFINNMRGIAILMIIYTHAIWSLPAPGGAAPLLDYLVGNGTIVFIFIAGYLFNQTTEQFNYLQYLRNKLLTVVLPYLIISTPASLLYILRIKTTHQWIDMNWFYGDLNAVGQYLYLSAMGAQLGPLWFVPMIVIFYVVSPIFLWFKNSNLIFPAILVTLALAVYAGRPEGNSDPLHSFVFYVPVYLLGIAAFRFSKQLMAFRPYVGAAFIAFAILDVALYFTFFAPPSEATDSVELLIYIPLVMLMMISCKQYLDRRIPILDMFGRLSFFLFFIHGYFAGFSRHASRVLLNGDAIRNPAYELAVITAIFVLIVFLSLAAYVALKFVLRDKSRFVIGG
jgi:surface polysaccharide O-acyltransferase-like enzyme